MPLRLAAASITAFALAAAAAQPTASMESAAPRRSRLAMESLMARLPGKGLGAPLRPVTLVLASGPQGQVPGDNDHPAWRRRWSAWLAKAPSVVVETAEDWPGPEQWTRADAVLIYNWKRVWTKEQFAELDSFQARGGALVMIHAAVSEGEEQIALSKRIGLAAQIVRTNRRHGPLDVKFLGTDALVSGFSTATLLDEIYWPLIGETSRVSLLAAAVEQDKDWPIAWTFETGKARVFATVLGRRSHTFEDPLVRLMVLRALAWSLKEPLDRFHERIWDRGAWTEPLCEKRGGDGP